MSSGKEHGNEKNHHSHDHEHDHDHDHSHGLGHSHAAHAAPQALRRAILITFAFMILEAVGGWIGNSLALMTDAAHMLTDIGALLVSLFAIWVSRRPSNSKMSFGYHRAEIIGGLLSGLAIWLIAGVLVYEAILRLQNPPEVQGPIVFVIASVGLIANLATMRMLHGSTHDNMNVRAAYLHMVSDALGSVGAVIAGLVIWLTGWRPIDPIITIVFAVLILFSSYELIREAMQILMESTPTGMNADQVRSDLQALPGVVEVHDLHIWTVASGRYALSVHLVSTDEHILASANTLLESKYRIVHTTIQVEHPERFVSERCYDCAPKAE